MMDDYQDDYDEECPHCGNPFVRWRHCEQIGCEDGWIDMHEYDDPLWYDEGETEMCPECHGTGIERWCPACGKDVIYSEEEATNANQPDL